MAQPTAESDPLFQLLTDALRAGPGSAEWQRAVAQVRLSNGSADAGTEEYKLLLDAREHLESGRDYRSVRAGAGFTRKVFEGIERQDPDGNAARATVPTANIVAIVSALGILAVLAVVGFMLFPRGDPPIDKPPTGVGALEKSYFPTEVASAKFEGGGGTGIPAGWRTIGQLPLDALKGGLKPAIGPATSPATGDQTSGGGLVAPDTFPADEPFAAEVSLKLNKPTEDMVVQVFVSGDDAFAGPSATSPNELVWLLRGHTQRVVSGDRVQAEAPRPDGKGDAIPVRILVDRASAVVFVNKQRVWAGPHGLPAGARHVGVRFIRVGQGKAADAAVVQSIRILKSRG